MEKQVNRGLLDEFDIPCNSFLLYATDTFAYLLSLKG